MSRLTSEQIAVLNRTINHYTPAQLAKLVLEGRVTLDELTALKGEKRELVEKIIREQPNAQEQAQWAEITALHPAIDDLNGLRALCTKLTAYIEQWGQTRPAGNHVDEAQTRLTTTKSQIAARAAQAEEADWQALTSPTGAQPTIERLAGHLSKYPETSHRNEIEEMAWNQVLQTKDMDAASALYLQYFPAGRHIADLDRLKREQEEWEAVATEPDILELQQFITTHPSSSYISAARQRYDSLRGEIFEKMRRLDNTISATYILQLLDAGITTEDELVQKGLCIEGFTEKLRSHVNMNAGLPDINTEITKCRNECAVDQHTDVYFFGIPSTGKSCILMGLIGAQSLSFDSVRAAGPYALALKQYLLASATIGSTPPDFVATLQSTIFEPDRSHAHYVNLVEIAGEDFACKIADNPNGDITFADMGKGIPELLANDNPKVFFLIIDPTTDCVTVNRLEPQRNPDGSIIQGLNGRPTLEPRTRNILQSLTIKRMVDLMCQPENEDVMNKVEAIHVIVTKADTLGNGAERDERASQIINELYTNILAPLIPFCREHNINRQTDYNPQFYTFSLGNFYIGGIYKYDSTDAEKLIDVIKELTPAYNLKRGFFGSIANFFNS